MIHQTCAGVLLSLALTVPASAWATWLSGSELRRHCDAYLENPESRDGALCVAFMQGFLSGTRTAETDAAGWSTASHDESFAERAARTRVGSRLRRLSAANAGYCVGDGVSAVTVIRTVTEYLDDDAERNFSAERRVRDALVQNFPCDEG